MEARPPGICVLLGGPDPGILDPSSVEPWADVRAKEAEGLPAPILRRDAPPSPGGVRAPASALVWVGRRGPGEWEAVPRVTQWDRGSALSPPRPHPPPHSLSCLSGPCQ